MLIHELLAKETTEELRREAEHYRLISSAQRHSTRRKNPYGLALAWLGSRLCKWGSLLDERFGEPGPVTSSQRMKSGIKA